MRTRRRKTIGVRGTRYDITGALKLGGRTLLVLDHPLSRRRTKYCVFDRHAGPRGDLRAMHIVSRDKAGYEYVNVVGRISEGNVNLPRLVEYRTQANRLYLILDWVHGRSLAAYLRTAANNQRLRPSPVEAFKLFRGLAHGLRHMHHKKNFVHGDVRPDNLVLCREPNRLVLIDFGSAWRVEKTRQREEGDGVSAFYAAPEQLQQRKFVDFRSDQFSASVVLYEMLTQELPYGGLGGKAGLNDYHAASMSQTWVPPRQLSADSNRIPRALWSRIDQIACRGLSLEPDQRYANAKEWLGDIDTVHFELLGKRTRTTRFFGFSHWVGSGR